MKDEKGYFYFFVVDNFFIPTFARIIY